ncbi:MAG: MBL fold metallo-hydrolase [Methanobacteriota archaeon]
MKLTFLGGVDEVGRLGMVLEHRGVRLLFDYGLKPEDPPKYPRPPPPLDLVALSHAHLDHCGMLPAVSGVQEVPVLTTSVSTGIAELLAHDSLKVAQLEGYPQPYGKADIRAMVDSFMTVDYGDQHSVGDLELGFHSAGHIPGSTMFEVTADGRKLLFTGDLNPVDSRLVKGAEPVPCDTLVVEATYSGRQHPHRPDLEKYFLERVAEVVESGGTVMVPAFAVGRTQEVLLLLAKEGYDLWLDGMGRTVSKYMMDEPRFCRDAKALKEAFSRAKVVTSRHTRDLAASHADVIVTTSGMVEGGPILHYLEHLGGDPKNGVFLTGFQVPGTNGRMLLDERLVDIAGVNEKVAAEVEWFDFSAHAGHDDVVRFAKGCGAKDVVLFHSDQREALAKELTENGHRVHLLTTGQELDLDRLP